MECTVTENNGIKWLNLNGRIDSMSSPEIEREISSLTLSGERTLVVNFEEVNFISSAGIRIFLGAQKQLKKVSGEIILYKMAQNVFDVFKLSGLDKVFQIVSEQEEINSILLPEKPAVEIKQKEIGGVPVQYTQYETGPAMLNIIGSQKKLVSSSYDKDDMIKVKPADIRFGTGLGAIGMNYGDYKNFFGESVILDRNFFFYPAVKRPAVDFMIHNPLDTSLEYSFFHGFGFNGEYKHIVSFEGTESFVDMQTLGDILFEISGANLIGVVLLGESKGFWGMHLKQVPLIENKPSGIENIFSDKTFSQWMDFPVEPGNINNIIAGSGIFIKDKTKEDPEVQNLFSKGSNFHIHAGIFDKEPLNKKIDQFDNELKRILTELEAVKVQHILGQTKFSSGMAAIIELRG